MAVRVYNSFINTIIHIHETRETSLLEIFILGKDKWTLRLVEKEEWDREKHGRCPVNVGTCCTSTTQVPSMVTECFRSLFTFTSLCGVSV